MLAKDMLAKTREKSPIIKNTNKQKDNNGCNLASNTEQFIQNNSKKVSSIY